MDKSEVYYSITGINNDFNFIDPKTNKNIGYVNTISTSIDPYRGFSADITITDRKFYDQIVDLYKGGSKKARYVKLPKKYQIKKVVVNPEKEATTVIFKDSKVEVVKKSPEDPEADIFSVVAYAVAKHVYGSNSAFKREVINKVEVMKFKEKERDASIDSLRKFVESLDKILKGVNK